MTVSFSLHGSIKTVSQGIDRARRAEALGYETLFTADSQMTCLDPFQAFAVCARETGRIRLGTAVTNMVFRDPSVLAGSAATLNEISGGRAVLGLGTGDGPVYGLGRKATPMARFEEGIQTIRELLRGRPITVPPGKISLQIGKLPVPVYVSVEGPKGLRVAGRAADGVILGTGFDLRVLEWARGLIAEGAREAGRSLSEIDIMVAGMISVDEDGERARTRVKRRLGNRAHHNFRFTLESVPPEELAGVERFIASFDVTKPLEQRTDASLVTDYLLRRFSIAGTADECIARLRELEKAGVARIMVTPPETVYNEVMEAWAKEVMPHFQ